MKDKKTSKWPVIFLWTVLGIIFMAFFVIATTTITDKEITTGNATFSGTDIEFSKLDALIRLSGFNSLLGGALPVGGISINQTIPGAKNGIWWDAWDDDSQRYRPVAWLVAHYNSSSAGAPHTHFSIETLDNSTGTPSINSHFAISYNSSQPRADVTFPTSDVKFSSDQELFFGDTKQAYISHNSVSGDLQLKSNADVLINATQLDIDGGDIVKVDDIFSDASLAMKPTTTFDIYPSGQTTRAVRFTDATTHATIQGTSATQIEFLDSVVIDTNDYLKLETNTSAITCDGTTAGAIIFASNIHLGCNSTDWNNLY